MATAQSDADAAEHAAGLLAKELADKEAAWRRLGKDTAGGGREAIKKAKREGERETKLAEAKAQAALQLAREQAISDAAALREAKRKAEEAARRAAAAKRNLDAAQADEAQRGGGGGGSDSGGARGGKPPLPPRGDRDIDRMSAAELEAALAGFGIVPGGGGLGGLGALSQSDVHHELSRRGLPLGKTREEEMRRLLQVPQPGVQRSVGRIASPNSQRRPQTLSRQRPCSRGSPHTHTLQMLATKRRPAQTA